MICLFSNFLGYIRSILSNKNVVWVSNSLRYKPDFRYIKFVIGLQKYIV